MFWKWSKKKEPVYHVGNEDVAVPEVHTGKVAHEQAAQQDTGESKTSTDENDGHPRGAYPPQKEKVIRQNKPPPGRKNCFHARPAAFLCMNNPDILSGTPRRSCRSGA